jgi:hypothetical protein
MSITDRLHQDTCRTSNNQHIPFRPAPMMKRDQSLGRLHFEQLQKRIAPLKHALLHHPVYDAVDSIDHCVISCRFMFSRSGILCPW